MGSTKALVEIDRVAMANRVADAMRGAGCSLLVALGGDPIELAPLGLPVVADSSPGAGPLPAVIAALDWARPASEVMILACDLPFITPGALGRLTAAAAARRDADVVVARTDRLEPACALWRRSARDRLAALVDEGERALHRAVAAISAVEVDVDPAELRNINTPDDLREYPGRHE
jgi:molybdopterin-guanine dinucleotide biosynthesis protein A